MAFSDTELYIINDNKHKRLWENALVVFDTSSLLGLYYYSDSIQETIINEVFTKLADRLRMPNHVNYEFLKNRESVIKKPISSYSALSTDLTTILNNQDTLKKSINELISKTKKNDKHPYFDEKIYDSIKESSDLHDKNIDVLVSEVKKNITSQIELLTEGLKKDRIYDALNSYFVVSPPIEFEKMLEIVKVGKLRYEFKIPPGYEDLEGRTKKEGLQIFGDLIIWKDILEIAKSENKAIILISNDSKADWCIKNTSNNIDFPRHELIREIWDYANVEFWMYNNAQLLHYSKVYLASTVTEAQIIEVSQVNEHSCRYELIITFDTEQNKIAAITDLMSFITQFDKDFTDVKNAASSTQLYFIFNRTTLSKMVDITLHAKKLAGVGKINFFLCGNGNDIFNETGTLITAVNKILELLNLQDVSSSIILLERLEIMLQYTNLTQLDAQLSSQDNTFLNIIESMRMRNISSDHQVDTLLHQISELYQRLQA